MFTNDLRRPEPRKPTRGRSYEVPKELDEEQMKRGNSCFLGGASASRPLIRPLISRTRKFNARAFRP